MIDTALVHIATALNQALRRSFSVSDDLVAVSSLHEPDGHVASQAANRLSVFLLNIERDTMPLSVPRTAAHVHAGQAQPPVHLNLLVMFAAPFAGSNYTEALKLIAGAIAFFQAHPQFDHHSTPDLDPRLDRLALDIVNLSFGELANVWGLLGGRYVPSVLYRVRMVSLAGDAPAASVPRITQARSGVQP